MCIRRLSCGTFAMQNERSAAEDRCDGGRPLRRRRWAGVSIDWAPRRRPQRRPALGGRPWAGLPAPRHYASSSCRRVFPTLCRPCGFTVWRHGHLLSSTARIKSIEIRGNWYWQWFLIMRNSSSNVHMITTCTANLAKRSHAGIVFTQ